MKSYSPYHLERMAAQRRKANALYASGLSTREVGKALNPPRSHAWVAVVIKGGDWKKPVDRKPNTPKKASVKA